MKLAYLTLLLAIIFTHISPTVVADEFLVDSDVLDFTENEATNSVEDRLSWLFPSLLIIITLVAFATDFGPTGVSLAAMGALVALRLIGLIYFTWVSFIAMFIMIAVVIYKAARS